MILKIVVSTYLMVSLNVSSVICDGVCDTEID